MAVSDRAPLLAVEDLRVTFTTERGTIHAVNGVSVDSLSELRRAVKDAKDGDPIVVQIERGGVFHYVAFDTPLWQTMIVMLAFGMGLGFNFQPLTLAVQNAVPPTQIGVATSTATFTRQIGGALGTAVFLSILFSTAGEKITAALKKAVKS